MNNHSVIIWVAVTVAVPLFLVAKALWQLWRVNGFRLNRPFELGKEKEIFYVPGDDYFNNDEDEYMS